MPIKVTCPKCGGVLHAPDDAGGKRGRCPTCANVLTIPADGVAAQSQGQSQLDGPRPSLGSFTGEPAPPPLLQPPDPTRASLAGGVGTGYKLADPEPRRVSPDKAPITAVPEPRRGPDPLAGRPFAPPPADEPAEVTDRRWARVRGGLGWVRAGVSLLVLAVVAPAGLQIYEQYAGPLPDKRPGYSGSDAVSTTEETYLGAALVPAVLGGLLVLIGRLGVARAPRLSGGRGLARLAALGTLLAVAGLAAAATPVVRQLLDNRRPAGWADAGTTDGLLERFGLAAAAGFGLAALGWFVVALGQMGAALGSRAAAGRAGRLVGLVGLVVALTTVGWVGYSEYPGEISDWLSTNAQPLWDKLGEHKTAARAGLRAAAALFAGVIYFRLTGGVRRAIRDRLANVPVR